MTLVLVVLDQYDKAVGRLTARTDEYSYGSVAQRQEASDSKSLQGVFESLQIHQRLFVRVALLAATKNGNSGSREKTDPTPTEGWSNLTEEQKSAAVLQ